MDSTPIDFDPLEYERSILIAKGLLVPSSCYQKTPANNIESKRTSSIKTTDVSDDNNGGLPMRRGDEQKNRREGAEENVVDECLNTTDSSLSAHDVDILNALCENVAFKTKKSMKIRVSERQSYRVLKDNNDTSEDEASSVKDLLSAFKNKPSKSVVPKYWVVKKRSPVRRNHIYSFFYAMADVVSTFTDRQLLEVKYNVWLVLRDVILGLKDMEEYSKAPLRSRLDILLMKHRLKEIAPW